MNSLQSPNLEQKPEITYREGTDADVLPGVQMRVQSWVDTYAFHGEYNGKRYDVSEEQVRAWIEPALSSESIAKRIEINKEMKASGKGNVFVATDARGEIVGIMTPYIDDDNVRHLGSLYTKKEIHGQGVGGELMRRAMEFLDAEHEDVALSVVLYNDRAKAFYRKWGFTEVPHSEHLHDDMMPEVDMIRKGGKL